MIHDGASSNTLGCGNGDGDQEQRDADADEVGAEDQHGQDDLDADAAPSLAFRHPAQQPGAVRRGLRQPAALTGDSFEHPAQPLRDGLLGRHRGVQPNSSGTL